MKEIPVADLDLQLELVGLMCSRICHDLGSPVGAIGNGIEMLEEEDDPDMRSQALAHIADSAAKASQRLKFLRLALGSGGGPGSRMALDEAGSVARAMFGSGRVSLDWRIPTIEVDRQTGRLLLNLVMVGEQSLPKGGRVEASLETADAETTIRLTARGAGARIPPEWDIAALSGPHLADLSPRGAQVCHARLLAQALGAALSADAAQPGVIAFVARLPR